MTPIQSDSGANLRLSVTSPTSRSGSLFAPMLQSVSHASIVCRFVQARLDALRSITKDDASPVTIADFASQAVIARHLHSLGILAGGLVGEESADFLKNPEHAGHLRACVTALRDSGVWPDCTPDEVIGAVDLGAADAAPLATPTGGWTLDPVDGTKGFLRNQQYCVSLAFIQNGRPILGVLGCPNLSIDPNFPVDAIDPKGSIYVTSAADQPLPAGGERRTTNEDTSEKSSHSAWSGSWGAPLDAPDLGRQPGSSSSPWIRQSVARMNATEARARLIRCAESVDAAHVSHSASAQVMARAAQIGGWSVGEPVRMDSQCKYALVARAQADVYLRVPSKKGYIEKIWDHAAGTLLAAESGCVVTDGYGQPLDFSRGRLLDRNQGIVAAPPEIHPAIVRAIDEWRSRSS